MLAGIENKRTLYYDCKMYRGIAEHDLTRPMHTRGAKGISVRDFSVRGVSDPNDGEEPYYFGTRPLERNTADTENTSAFGTPPPQSSSSFSFTAAPPPHVTNPTPPTDDHRDKWPLRIEHEGKKISKYGRDTVDTVAALQGGLACILYYS